MPIRSIPLVIGQVYHIFNRGVADQPTFTDKREYKQALLGISYYRFENPPVKLSSLKELSLEDREAILNKLKRENKLLVEILCFALMPNHFHLLIEQVSDRGISTFMRKFSDSYTRYFNTKNKRKGPLFQGMFKAVRIINDEQLIHVSRYIHLNPLVSYVAREREFLSYPWTSLEEYLTKENNIINSKIILSEFRSPREYKRFILDQVDYGRKLEEIKHLLIEQDT